MLFSAHKLIEFIRLNNMIHLFLRGYSFCDAQFVLDFVESLREFISLINKVIFCRIDYPAPAVNLFVQDSCIELIKSMYALAMDTSSSRACRT